jgi:uncharacterized protein YjbJ (UPF0337 family)
MERRRTMGAKTKPEGPDQAGEVTGSETRTRGKIERRSAEVTERLNETTDKVER